MDTKALPAIIAIKKTDGNAFLFNITIMFIKVLKLTFR
jgi:hypothetical protein